jgi:hypothetical protein
MMISRRLLLVSAIIAIAVCFFTLGVMHTRRAEASVSATYDARIEALRDEMRRVLGSDPVPAGTTGEMTRSRGRAAEASPASRAQMVAEIKQELQSEMGLLPVQLLRERRSSFVELYADDNFGKTSYGTAGYLGHGYLVTVKHAVVALKDDDNRQAGRKIVAIKVVYHGKEIPARFVDAGKADVEVDNGDWAIIRTRDLDLPALKVDTAFAYDFADPIFRLGNDYSKGIVVSTGYVGQKTAGGLITCLTDGHPGVSGGGVLDQRGDLVGIPIGRMQGDYRFSFILPMRREMLRKVPGFEESKAVALASIP